MKEIKDELTLKQIAENTLSPNKIRLFLIQNNCPVKKLTVEEVEKLADHINNEVIKEFERVFYNFEVTK